MWSGLPIMGTPTLPSLESFHGTQAGSLILPNCAGKSTEIWSNTLLGCGPEHSCTPWGLPIGGPVSEPLDASEQFVDREENPTAKGVQLASTLFVCPPQIHSIRANRNLISCSSVLAMFIHTQSRKDAAPRPAHTPELIVPFLVVIANPVVVLPPLILVTFNHRAALPIRIHLTAVPSTLVCLAPRSSLCLRCMGTSRAISRNPQLPHTPQLFRRLQARCVRGQEAQHHLPHEIRGPISWPGQNCMHACVCIQGR